MSPRSPSGIASSRIVRNTNGGTSSTSAATTIADKNSTTVRRYGRAKRHARRNAPRSSFLPFTADVVAGHHHVWSHAHAEAGYARPLPPHRGPYDAHMPPHPLAARRAFAAFTLTGLALAACGDGIDEGSRPTTTAPAVDTTEPAVDTPVPQSETIPPDIIDPDDPFGWMAVEQGIFEGRLVVPLDHDDPNGTSITLYLVKNTADDPARRIGSLLVNPGGPGLRRQRPGLRRRLHLRPRPARPLRHHRLGSAGHRLQRPGDRLHRRLRPLLRCRFVARHPTRARATRAARTSVRRRL